jgi:TolB protein
VTIGRSFLTEVGDEFTSSRRLIERVPSDKGQRKPHPKSSALGHLTQLVCRMPKVMSDIVKVTLLFVLVTLSACDDSPTGLVSDARGLILFYRQSSHASSEIWVVHPDGRDARQLTSNSIWDGDAHWSPDGRRIVFASERDSNPGWPVRRAEIHVMNADGSNVRKLTNSVDGSRTPRWSPDGTRIAFARRDDSGYRVYVMNADGTNLRAVTPADGPEFLPDWSPDGNRILYISSQPPLYRPRMHIVNVDGTGAQMLGGDAACDGHVSDARWSPDGTRILYSCARLNGQMIFTMNADGTDVVQLSRPDMSGAAVYDWAVAWSPDGRQIAFSSSRAGDLDVYVMSSTGENPTRVTDEASTDIVSDWNRPR